jgi:hypothetical protein
MEQRLGGGVGDGRRAGRGGLGAGDGVGAGNGTFRCNRAGLGGGAGGETQRLAFVATLSSCCRSKPAQPLCLLSSCDNCASLITMAHAVYVPLTH